VDKEKRERRNSHFFILKIGRQEDPSILPTIFIRAYPCYQCHLCSICFAFFIFRFALSRLASTKTQPYFICCILYSIFCRVHLEGKITNTEGEISTTSETIPSRVGTVIDEDKLLIANIAKCSVDRLTTY